MVVVKIALALCCLGGIVWGVYALESYIWRRYEQRFFTAATFTCSLLAFSLLLVGHSYWLEAKAKASDDLNGLALMGVGGLIAVCFCLWNVRRTNLATGAIGSLLHAALFTIIGRLGAVAIVASFVVWAFLIATSQIKTGAGAEVDEDEW